jgi:hypothetical protein
MPTSSHSRTVCRTRSNQTSREFGSRRWSVTLTRSYANEPWPTTGRTSRSGAAVENPALAVGAHCIGVRIAVRSGSDRSSPMPISSPYRITGVPGMVSWRE